MGVRLDEGVLDRTRSSTCKNSQENAISEVALIHQEVSKCSMCLVTPYVEYVSIY